MAGNSRTAEDVRRDLASERDRLAGAVDDLRRELGEVTDVSGKLRANLPAAAAAALGAGFVLAGGIGSTMRWFARRSREGREEARLGRFSFVRRR
ncbi:MAG TPA: hypothetical protein VHF67_03585 [Gaiellaceae bacterium]|nr:hypothetical protein [Gaiellaceae bacterium]